MTANVTPVGLGGDTVDPSFDQLLPGDHETLRCAEHARSIAIDPAGTAIRADRIVLVETPPPWPKPVFAHEQLGPVDGLYKNAAILTRMMACVPERRPTVSGPMRLWVFDRGTGSDSVSTRERAFEFRDSAELLDLSRELCAESGDDAGTTNGLKVDRTLDDPTVLVCAQGSHDVCCGSDGQRLIGELTASAADVRVFSVSHTGGHRFAPTAMTLPDGRMWAFLGADVLRSILNRTANIADVAQYCRGWWGAERGEAQVAERAVLSELGWSLDAMIRTVTPTPDGARVEVAGGDGPQTYEVEVSEARRVPTLSCRAPGGQPVKETVEYAATAITAVG